MIVAAHQPGYLPWLGFFHRIASADLFVLFDDVQFERQNFQNRARIKMNNGPRWLTVPVARGDQAELLCDKRIAEPSRSRNHWQHTHWASLCHHYGATPHFHRYAVELGAVYRRRWDRLVDLNLHLIELCLRWFEIRCPLVRSSALHLSGRKTERIVNLCKRIGASTYLSGAGGSCDYLDVALLRSASVAVRWQAFDHPIYAQRYSALGFVSHLSALDFLFNCGPLAARSFAARKSNKEVNDATAV